MDVVERFKEQLVSKQEQFKHGYRAPAINQLKFQSTVDNQMRFVQSQLEENSRKAKVRIDPSKDSQKNLLQNQRQDTGKSTTQDETIKK